METKSTPPIRLAVDIGGTFTDLQMFDARNGRLAGLKTPTTPEDPSVGLMEGIREAAARFGFALPDVSYVLHGTTIATNAVLERKLPDAALVTTAGFEDVLEIGRHYRREVYALNPRVPPTLIPRDRRLGIEERIRADGSIATPLSADGLDRLVRQLEPLDVSALAVCLLNSYLDPEHERRIAEHVARTLPCLRISCSHEISAEIREYERTSTTVLNALLMPVVAGYVEKLVRRMQAERFHPKLLLVQSNGGMCTVETASREPVRLLLSGPSGGATACAMLAVTLGEGNVVGVDMGGTSLDVSVVRAGRVTLVAQGEVDLMPVRLPMVEVRTVGAGGGSVAKVLSGGRLTVGPRSAGARPGPACYGRGGKEPTVTDANAVLRRLDAASFLGGQMKLDVEAARAVIETEIAEPLGLPVDAAAEGLLAVTNASLGAAIRLSLFEKGLDPRDFALVAFGGAAGLHAIAVASELGLTRVIFPANASTFSALGILHTHIVHDVVRSRVVPATPVACNVLAASLDALLADATSRLQADGIAPADRRVELAADMRYCGQAFELTVPMQGLVLNAEVLDRLLADFHALHRQRFSYADPGAAVEIVTLRASGIGRLPFPDKRASTRKATAEPTCTRRVRLDGAWRDVAIIARDGIPEEPAINGPAIIEEDYTTVLLPAGWTCAAREGHLIATRVD